MFRRTSLQDLVVPWQVGWLLGGIRPCSRARAVESRPQRWLRVRRGWLLDGSHEGRWQPS
ncbi:MAG: hypothetical protein OT477_01235 [Chloroflexi bacterium]|nr:hypothetical protein [Chloroflexota bacterium]